MVRLGPGLPGAPGPPPAPPRRPRADHRPRIATGGGRAALHANTKAMKIQTADNADSYEVEHPVVRTHPDTGRKSLYLGMHVSHVDGVPEAEGKAPTA